MINLPPAYLKNAGFTLIETLIYIALLAFIIGSGVAASFYVIDSSQREGTNINAIAEAAFLMRKIDWALNGADSINVSDPTTLKVTKGGLSIWIHAPSDRALISKDGGSSWIELTGEWVKITSLSFQDIPAVPPKPAGVTTKFEANGKLFEMTKYLRK